MFMIMVLSHDMTFSGVVVAKVITTALIGMSKEYCCCWRIQVIGDNEK
jgi:hypothetical protein